MRAKQNQAPKRLVIVLINDNLLTNYLANAAPQRK